MKIRGSGKPQEIAPYGMRNFAQKVGSLPSPSVTVRLDRERMSVTATHCQQGSSYSRWYECVVFKHTSGFEVLFAIHS